MQQELIEMLDKMVKYFDEIPSDSYYYRETASILNEAEKLVEKAKNCATEPAVPQGEPLTFKEQQKEWADYINRCDSYDPPDRRHAFLAGLARGRALALTAPSQPSKYGSPELQALIVAHATQEPVLQCAIYEMADALYKRGYTDLQSGKDYDPRGCDEWQEVVDCLAAPSQPMTDEEKQALVYEKLYACLHCGAPSQEPALHIGACITDGVLHATVMRREANGHVTILATAEMDAKSLLKHDCVAKLSHAAPSQPVTLTVEEANAIKLTSWTDEENYGAKFCDGFNAGVNAIIAALRAKEQAK